QAVLREEQKLENGGPGAPGDRVIEPMGNPPARRPGSPEVPGDVQPVQPGGQGSPETVPGPGPATPGERERMGDKPPPQSGPEVKPPPEGFSP
ncbi:MAG TPA: hypothetical protein VIG99_30035, partial [Myxococcaceae bacterium]